MYVYNTCIASSKFGHRVNVTNSWKKKPAKSGTFCLTVNFDTNILDENRGKVLPATLPVAATDPQERCDLFDSFDTLPK